MGINYFILHQIDFRRAPIRVLPCLHFYFQFKTESPDYEDYDEITELGEDNSEALAAHGWVPGRSCWLYVFPDGTLGHCSPEDSLPNILIGLALSLLLSGHLFYVIYRIYRCKSSLSRLILVHLLSLLFALSLSLSPPLRPSHKQPIKVRLQIFPSHCLRKSIPFPVLARNSFVC